MRDTLVVPIPWTFDSAAVRLAFDQAAASLVTLVGEVPDTSWSEPALGRWDTRSLVGHAARGLQTVTTYLDEPNDGTIVVDHPVEYYFAIVDQYGNTESVYERGVEAGERLGADPRAAVAGFAEAAIMRVGAARDDDIVATPFGGIPLGAYLPTRVLELTVHTIDLAAALGRVAPVESTPRGVSLAIAAALAERRGEGETLLLALTGRVQLPDHFGVL
jgi:uncharacterized protein (TIGR03083 family)